jgi:hypothetical protein
MSSGADRFDRSLFINCPFDPEYLPLLQSLIFTVLECGLEPRLALDGADSGEARVYKIRNLIRSCRFSIHDISRIEPLRDGDLPRFNMMIEVRNWLKVATRLKLPSGSSLVERYGFFWVELADIFQRMRYLKRDIESLEVVEYIEMIRDWQIRRPADPVG